MTGITITPYKLNEMCVIAGIDATAMTAALTAAGITIAPPEPPEAMAKLAREIAASWDGNHPTYRKNILLGYCDDHSCVLIALAALQHAAKMVMDMPQAGYDADVGGDTVSRVHILQALGAEQ